MSSIKREAPKISRHPVVFVFLGLFLGTLFTLIFHRPGWILFDHFQKNAPIEINDNVALVTVDQASLDQLEKNEGMVFPLPRQVYGAVVEVAQALDAKAVAFDIIFSESSAYGVSDDELFAQLLKKSKVPVFFPAASENKKVKEPIPIIKDVATGLGGVHVDNEADGIFRHVPNEVVGSESIIPTLSHQVFKFLRPDAQFNNGFLQYYAEGAFPHVPIYNLLRAYNKLQEDGILGPEFDELRDRIWFIGYTAPGLHDLKATSVNRESPGVIIPLTGLANRLDKKGLQPLPVWQVLVLLFLFNVICIFIANLSEDPYISTFGIFFAALVFPYLISSNLWEAQLWFDPIPMTLGALLAGGFQVIWNFQKFFKERLQLAKSLQYSMSPDMVELIKKGDIEVKRFGENRQITVLFSDLAGFTTLSEQSDPEDLVEVLNAYLDDVVHLITEHKGYVDKFIGDAVMAIWGAPVQQEEHTKLALSAAWHFQDVCEKFNERMREKNPNFPKLHTRVGVHTGHAIVGNMGAQHRHNYTAIGDTVNLAARLEGMGKNYGVGLTISEDVIEAVGKETFPGLLELDQVIVKGKSKPTRIYTYVNPEHSGPMFNYKSGLEAYYKGSWPEALDKFRGAQEISASQIMIARCEKAIKDGSLDLWQEGAWAYDSK